MGIVLTFLFLAPSVYAMEPSCPVLLQGLGDPVFAERPTLEKVRFDAILAELAYRRALRKGESGAFALLVLAKEARYGFAAFVLAHDSNWKLAHSSQIVEAIWSSHTAKTMLEKARALREPSELGEVERYLLRPLYERDVLGNASDGDLLLRAVHAKPEEDTPRLAYADWCDENEQGDRAEFIRLQIEQKRNQLNFEQGRELTPRIQVLLEKHRAEWLGDLEGLRTAVTFERGFPASVKLTQADILTHLPRLGKNRTIRELYVLEGWDQPVIEGSKAGRRFLSQLTTLELHGPKGIGAEVARHLAAEDSSLKNLTHLILSARIGPKGARYLAAENSALKNLTSLHLAFNDISDEGVRHLAAENSALRKLTDLDLGWNEIGAVGAGYLAAENSSLKNLTHLSLWNNRIGPEGARYLAAENSALKKLTRLKLKKNLIGFRGAGHLAAESSALKKLTDLSLYGNGIGTVGRALLNHPTSPVRDVWDDSY